MNLGLKNKNALITGGSQGIGLAIAKALAEEGCNAVLRRMKSWRLPDTGRLEEVERYTRAAGCAKLADSAMAKLK